MRWLRSKKARLHRTAKKGYSPGPPGMFMPELPDVAGPL